MVPIGNKRREIGTVSQLLHDGFEELSIFFGLIYTPELGGVNVNREEIFFSGFGETS